MPLLDELLGSRTRAGILATLSNAPATEFHLNDLAKKVGVGARAVQQEVARLLRLGLIRERRSGNRRYFSADTSHPAYKALSELIRITAGAQDVLREALAGDSRILLALLFGSVAFGTERTESDVDLLVVGDLGLGELLQILSPAQEALRRPINPVLMTAAEFRVPTSNEERRNLRAIVARELQDSQVEAISLDARLGMLYNAALKLAEMALRAHGYRVPAGGGRQHERTSTSLVFESCVIARTTNR